MILVLDAGNSRLKWAESRPDGWFPGSSFPLTGDAPPVEWQALARPERVVGGSVAGASAGERIAAWTRAQWGREPEWLGSTAEAFGVRNAYREPARLGIDRWAALLSAHRAELAPVCIVDCGSAITVDVLARDGRHLGGWIAPGRGMMGQCLLTGTADIRFETVASGSPGALFGRDTAEAVEGGTRAALAGLVERALRAADTLCEDSVACLFTGGDAEWLAPGISRPCRIVPDLVLRGLAQLAGVHSSGIDL